MSEHPAQQHLSQKKEGESTLSASSPGVDSTDDEKYWSRRSTHHLWPQIAELVRAGRSMRAAATDLGVSYETAARACRAAGIVRRRGFGSMDPDLQRQIAQKGGKAAQAQGKVHHFTSEEASAAGKKGWQLSPRSPDHMRKIGKMGGQASVVARQGGSPRELREQDPRDAGFREAPRDRR